MKTSQLPSFRYEKKLWKCGFKFVAGIDEVGRGCFAGPVVAATVVFRPQNPKSKFQIPNKVIINDSKKLSARQRERADGWIKENAFAWGIGEAPVAIINRLGMGKATKMAFRKAVLNVNNRLQSKSKSKIEYLLADAFFIPYVPGLPTRRRKDRNGRFKKNPKGRQQAIIDGDQKSFSIAAASIIAKVYRDRLMLNLSKQSGYKKYGWGRNKGYGTAEHREIILKYGITRYHRKQFVKNFI